MPNRKVQRVSPKENKIMWVRRARALVENVQSERTGPGLLEQLEDELLACIAVGSLGDEIRGDHLSWFGARAGGRGRKNGDSRGGRGRDGARSLAARGRRPRAHQDRRMSDDETRMKSREAGRARESIGFPLFFPTPATPHPSLIGSGPAPLLCRTVLTSNHLRCVFFSLKKKCYLRQLGHEALKLAEVAWFARSTVGTCPLLNRPFAVALRENGPQIPAPPSLPRLLHLSGLLLGQLQRPPPLLLLPPSTLPLPSTLPSRFQQIASLEEIIAEILYLV